MYLEDLIPAEKMKQALADRLVNRQTHPSAPLSIYNYSKIVQFANAWDEVTETCRGLIVNDESHEVIARPFRKFGNYGQVKIPNHAMGSHPAVFEKVDGSCGISYEVDGETFVATRGSFESDQAVWASEWLQKNSTGFRSPEGVTTLWEIVYSSNRIVVDYGGFEGLVLLGAIDIDSGADIPLWEIDWWDGERADHHAHIKRIQDAHNFANARDREQTEGVVLAWYRPGEPSFRLKCKGAEYVRLHRVITNCSSKTIWESLRAGDSLAELIENVPDEFYAWVEETMNDLKNAHLSIYLDAQREFDRLMDLFAVKIGDELILPDNKRKDFAAQAQKWPHPGLLFSLLDGKSINDTVWKLVKPAYERPYVQDPEA